MVSQSLDCMDFFLGIIVLLHLRMNGLGAIDRLGAVNPNFNEGITAVLFLIDLQEDGSYHL